jgi:hypothetical protein
MNAAIIGTSKIAQIHLREFIKKKFKIIYVATRNPKKIIKILKKKSVTATKIIPVKLLELKKLNYNFISVCTPTRMHHKHIFFLKKKKTIFFIEKPLISYLRLGKKFDSIYNKIYSSNLKILVSYPMYFMALTFLRKFKINLNTIKKISIHYQTTGNHKNHHIAEDLLPHALSFFYGIFFNKIKFLKFISSNVYNFRNRWSCKIKFNFLKLNIFFTENNSLKKSNFYFKIDKKKFIRKMKLKKNEPEVSISYKKKSRKIKNPMNMNINSLLNYKNFKLIYDRNKKMTDFIFDIQKKLLVN